MNKTILIIDDEPDLVRLTTFRLQHAGYHVITASNAQSFFETIKSEMPDLILLDLHLSGTSGFEICRMIKENEKTKNIPVLFFSASSMTDPIKKKIKEMNAQGFIQKPFNHDELIFTIRQLI